MQIQQHSFYKDYLQIFQRTEEKALSSTYAFLLHITALFSSSFPPILIMLKHLFFISRKVLSNSDQNIFTNEQK